MSSSVKRLYKNLGSTKKFWVDLQKEVKEYDPNEKISEQKIIDYYDNKYGLKLMPLYFWYDRIHIARVDYYKNYVYNKDKSGVTVKNFIEDTFGQKERMDLKINGMSAFKKYNTFILFDNKKTAVAHAGGRTYRTKK